MVVGCRGVTRSISGHSIEERSRAGLAAERLDEAARSARGAAGSAAADGLARFAGGSGTEAVGASVTVGVGGSATVAIGGSAAVDGWIGSAVTRWMAGPAGASGTS